MYSGRIQNEEMRMEDGERTWRRTRRRRRKERLDSGGCGRGMVSAWVGEEKVGGRTEMWAGKMEEVCTGKNAVGGGLQQADKIVDLVKTGYTWEAYRHQGPLRRSAVAQRSFAVSTAPPGLGEGVAW